VKKIYKSRNFLILIIIIAISLTLCVSCKTSYEALLSQNGMTNKVSIDSNIGLGEKLEILGYEDITMTYPEIYNDGPLWVERLVQMLDATHSYFIATVFLGSECDLNQEVFDLMKEKAQSGVDVYLVIDSSSSLDMTESRFYLRTLYGLRDYGVHLLEYNKFSLNRIPWGINLLYREHRKYFVSDGLHVAVGGMNLNYISNNSVANGGDRDAMYVFDSASCAKKLSSDFIDFWNTYSWEEIDFNAFDVVCDGTCKTSANVYSSNEVENGAIGETFDDTVASNDASEKELLNGWIANQVNGGSIAPLYGAVLAEAKEEVLILPFLPTLDYDMYDAVKACTSRGVKIQMILRHDDRESMLNAAKYSTKYLLDVGVDVWMEDPNAYTNGSLLHEKLLIVDERYVICGSSNFNHRSMHSSSELTLLIDSPELAKQLKEHYLEIQDYSYQVTYDQAEEWHGYSNKFNYIVMYFGG